jgi:hypothetical protein
MRVTEHKGAQDKKQRKPHSHYNNTAIPYAATIQGFLQKNQIIFQALNIAITQGDFSKGPTRKSIGANAEGARQRFHGAIIVFVHGEYK